MSMNLQHQINTDTYIIDKNLYRLALIDLLNLITSAENAITKLNENYTEIQFRLGSVDGTMYRSELISETIRALNIDTQDTVAVTRYQLKSLNLI